MVLADKFLLNPSVKIDDFDIVLGSNALHCIPDKVVNFGSPIPSSYLSSPLGALLVGSIDNLKSNIDSLPILSDKLVQEYMPILTITCQIF